MIISALPWAKVVILFRFWNLGFPLRLGDITLWTFTRYIAPKNELSRKVVKIDWNLGFLTFSQDNLDFSRRICYNKIIKGNREVVSDIFVRLCLRTVYAGICLDVGKVGSWIANLLRFMEANLMQSIGKIVQLKCSDTGTIIANIPKDSGSTISNCLAYLGATYLQNGKVLIQNAEYDCLNLVVEKRVIRDKDIQFLIDMAKRPLSVHDFILTYAQEIGFLPPEVTLNDIEFVLQMGVLWLAVNMPLPLLMDKLELPDDTRKWLCEKGPIPVDVRIRMAKSAKFLTIQDLT